MNSEHKSLQLKNEKVWGELRPVKDDKDKDIISVDENNKLSVILKFAQKASTKTWTRFTKTSEGKVYTNKRRKD